MRLFSPAVTSDGDKDCQQGDVPLIGNDGVADAGGVVKVSPGLKETSLPSRRILPCRRG